MKKFIVFHHERSHQDKIRTEFKGDDLFYSIDENGVLRLGKWETLTQTGGAVFAPGEWSYLITSQNKENP